MLPKQNKLQDSVQNLGDTALTWIKLLTCEATSRKGKVEDEEGGIGGKGTRNKQERESLRRTPGSLRDPVRLRYSQAAVYA